MIRSSRPATPTWRAWAAGVGAVFLFGLVLASCAKKLTQVDASFVQPEGRLSADAQLVAWAETPAVVKTYEDIFINPGTPSPPGPGFEPACPQRRFEDPLDRLIDSSDVEFFPAGTVHLLVLDHSPATAFHPMRREANGGFRGTLDFALTPTRRWLENQWEVYSYDDLRPSGFTPPTYVARGIVNGYESAGSPLTNVAKLDATDFQDITYTGLCLPCDSLFTIRWSPVAGAVRYWVHVFQLAPGATTLDRVRAAQPAPINLVKPKDFLVAAFPPTTTSYRLGDMSRTDIVRLIERPPTYGQVFQVRIVAVDSTGRMIAISRGDLGVIAEGGTYELFQLNAALVQPKKPLPDTPPRCQTETALGLAAASTTWMPRGR